MVKVIVSLNKCTGDGVCVSLCPVGAFELREVPRYEAKKAAVINNDACIVCKACEQQCSEQAITISE